MSIDQPMLRHRNLLASLVLTALTLTLAAVPTAAANAETARLFANGGFERPTPAGTGPLGWQPDTETPTSTLTWDNTVSHSGRHSVRIDSPEPADVWWLQTVAVTPHTLYRLSGWVKSLNVARSSEERDPGANISLLGSFDRSVAVLGTKNWTEVALTVDSGDLTQLNVVARLGFWGGTTTGTAWFDDLHLTAVSTTDRVANGDFERGSPKPGAIPADWGEVESQAAATFSWDCTVTHHGRHSARIDTSSVDDAMWAQGVNVRPHTRYELSGWIKTSNVTNSPDVINAGANLSFLGTYDRSEAVLGSQDWTFVSVTIDSADQTHLIVAARLGFWSGQTTGTAWFDDLSLTPLT